MHFIPASYVATLARPIIIVIMQCNYNYYAFYAGLHLFSPNVHNINLDIMYHYAGNIHMLDYIIQYTIYILCIDTTLNTCSITFKNINCINIHYCTALHILVSSQKVATSL